MSVRPCNLEVDLGPLRLRNPILSASGTYGHGLEMRHFTPPELLGGLVSKTVTIAPRPGNAAPRICETELGLLNSIGLENKGVDHYIANVLPEVASADTMIIANIGGESPQEYAEMAAKLGSRPEIDALEVNLSCPNVQGGRIPFGTDPKNAWGVMVAVRAVTAKPIFAKLSPNVTRIDEMAKAVEDAGADGITAVNTLLGMAVDWRTGKPGIATVQGGYSGPAIKPVALRCAWECAKSVSIPVIGCGGIASAEDALEYLAVGCRAVQVGTGSFADPALPGKVAAEMLRLLTEAGYSSVADFIGSLKA
ncbi:MAG: dihydroorotate dehydrogenase (NAD+) catalytic subunit [Planctomycetota bacterium]|jgi:dihydroorotate dehydrogenase (NAD+) catalytic subunit